MSERDIRLIGALAMASGVPAGGVPRVCVITDAAGGVDCFVPACGPVQNEMASCAPLDEVVMRKIEGRDRAPSGDGEDGVS